LIFFFFFFQSSFIIRESRCNYTGWIWSKTRSRSTGCTHILQYSYEQDNKVGACSTRAWTMVRFMNSSSFLFFVCFLWIFVGL
jgi:hypothetical protein